MKHFLISRTDNIGDVVLTLPVAGVLREMFPDCKISFLAKQYTKPILDACRFVDNFLNWDELMILSESQQIEIFRNQNFDTIIHVFPQKKIARLARLARIPIRIGSARRTFHFINCNKKVNFSRKNSNLHEAQLNLKLLRPLGFKKELSISEIPSYYGFDNVYQKSSGIAEYFSDTKFNIVIHPKSKGSAREWGLRNFSRLVEILPTEKFNILVTGTSDEGIIIKGFLDKYRNNITDLTGKLSLNELINLLYYSDGIVAASTGPLHIASALGINALGIYAPMRPIFPERWAPVGKNADYLVFKKNCNDCKKSKDCVCIRSITPEQVLEKLLSYKKINR